MGSERVGHDLATKQQQKVSLAEADFCQLRMRTPLSRFSKFSREAGNLDWKATFFIWNLIWEGRAPGPVACSILVPWPGLPVLEARRPNHWTAKEVHGIWLLYGFYGCKVNTARGVIMYRTNKTHPVAKSAQMFHLVTSDPYNNTWISVRG